MNIQEESLLGPYRVLDLTDESGFFCGKVLADLGADVVKVEAPGGDAARLIGPFVGESKPSSSLYWDSYNTNKRGATLALDRVRGRQLFLQLVRSAHFLVETFPVGYLGDLGIGWETLRRENPSLVLISITPFGQKGPYAHYKGSDLVAMAMSGMLSLVGEPGEEPLRVSLPQSPMWTGMYAAAGAMVAHYYRARSGEGQQVDISHQSGQLWSLANAPAFWATNRTSPKRAGRLITGRSITGAQMQALYRCKDGYINFIIYGGAAGRRSNQALVQWMDEEGFAPKPLKQMDWSTFNIQTITQEEVDAMEEPISKLFLAHTKAEFLQEAYEREILGYPVSTAEDILADPHLEARSFWEKIHSPAAGRELLYPGAFARFAKAEVGPKRPAPGVGQHNQEIYCDELGLSESEFSKLGADGVI